VTEAQAVANTSAAVPVPGRSVRPTGMVGVLRFMIRAVLTMFVGLKVTLRKLVGPKVTVQYPHEKPVMSGAFRSAIALVSFDDLDGTHDCIACDACELICPSYCITVRGERMPDSKKKRATEFLVDFSTCSLCGLCLAVCPTDTLKYSSGYDEAGYERGWMHNLLEPYADDPPAEDLLALLTARDEAKRAARKAARVAKEAPAPAAPSTPDTAAPAESDDG